MPFEIATIPCLDDNYAFLIHSTETGETAVVDVPDAAPILEALKARNWQLSEIWITHHHYDHVDGVADLRAQTGAKVIGGADDAHRLPPLNAELKDGENFQFAGHEVNVFDVSGHTINHIAFYFAAANALFTADSLMAMGCGRLFEGTPEQMLASLSKFSVYPGDTLVCSGHEYTASNAKFALTIEPNNTNLVARVADITAARKANQPTVPSTLALERATNPFLRAHLPETKAAIGMANDSDAAVFTEIRHRKDVF